MQRKFFLVRAAAGCVAVALAAVLVCVVSVRAGESIDRVVATVDGEPITLADVRGFAAQTGNPMADGDQGTSETFKAALKALIAEKLLQEEVKKYEDRVDDTQVDHYISDLEEERNISDQQLRQSLMQSGVTYDDFRKHARIELEKAMMLNNELRQKINIPPADIQAYYDAHKDDFTIKQERYKLAQILIATAPNATPAEVAAAKAKAESVRKKAMAGGDFGELARQYSDDESKAQGGELGSFAPADIMDEILAAIKNLKPGDISEVVKSSHGFHILKLEEHDVPGPKPLPLVKEEIRNILIDQRAKSQLQQWVEKDLIKQHYVEIY
jgi:peptidyl-prolyl cis-trans isomerase SurA